MTKLQYLTFALPKGSGGGLNFNNCPAYLQALGNRAYSEKLSDIIVWEKCEFYSSKSQCSFCIYLYQSQKGAITQSKV